jgi:hypothetical protein
MFMRTIRGRLVDPMHKEGTMRTLIDTEKM